MKNYTCTVDVRITAEDSKQAWKRLTMLLEATPLPEWAKFISKPELEDEDDE